jgi:hemerythrin
MKTIRITSDLITGIPMIDQQHREFFKRIAAFLECVEAGKCDWVSLGNTYTFLEAYAIEHFDAEKSLMTQAQYPEVVSHLKMHAAFVAQLEAMNPANFNEEDDGAGLRMSFLLVDYLKQHIAVTDQKLARWLKERQPEQYGQAKT